MRNHSVIACSSDQEVADAAMWQALWDAVVDEFITIKSRKAVVGTEPEEATRIGYDLVNPIACNAISGGVGTNRKLFGANVRGCYEKQYEDCDDWLQEVVPDRINRIRDDLHINPHKSCKSCQLIY